MIMMPYGRCRSSLQLTGTQTSGTPQAGSACGAAPARGRVRPGVAPPWRVGASPWEPLLLGFDAAAGVQGLST